MKKLKKNSYTIKAYWAWWGEHPTNWCGLIWGFISMILTLPLFPGRILYWLTEEKDKNLKYNYDTKFIRGFKYFLMTLAVFSIGALLGILVVQTVIHPWEALRITGWIIGGIIGLILSFGFFNTKFSYNAKEYVKARKQKICPRIEWEE